MLFDSISGKPEYPVITTLANFRLPSFSIFDVICLIKYTNLKLITFFCLLTSHSIFFSCAEPKTLRVSVNTFLDLLTLVVNTIDGFDPKNFPLDN